MINTTLQQEMKKYAPVLLMARLLPRLAMKRLRFLFALLFASSLGIIFLLQNNLLPAQLHINTVQAIGLCLIFGALWLEQICLYAYHNWHYFQGVDSVIGKSGKSNLGVTYEVAEIFSQFENDATRSFLVSSFGQNCLERLEIPPEEIASFLQSQRSVIPTKNLTLATDQITSLTEVIIQLYELDSAWQTMLSEKAVSKEILLGTVEFLSEISLAQKRAERWWSRDVLSRTVGIGRELAYGDTPFINQFSKSLLLDTIFSTHASTTPYTIQHATNVLNILAAHSASNVLLVGPVGVGKMDVVYTVAQLLSHGEGLHALRGHHVVAVDTERLFTTSKSDDRLEEQVVHFFEEALTAGNITIVIPSLHTFIREGERRGVIVTDILEKYLSHEDLHIIAIDTPENHHHTLRNYQGILRRFENILIEPASSEATQKLLKVVAHDLETKTDKIISYPALLLVAKSAERYLTDGVMPDRAITLLERIFDMATDQLITHTQVATYVSSITGIDTGPLTENEREHLLNLENTLATYVTGQTHAVKAVADTLRRVRIDTTRHDKPKGSFLFLGPTGVGKTALAKTLAMVYSKSDDELVRFDMSEFSHPDALGYLIGDHNGTGMLTDKLHDHPFRVILFDEFEKAHFSIHDLFLQILDEGYFTSSQGDRIDARNTIIIATSNAGSTLISKTASTHPDNPIMMEEILRHLIDQQIFRQELLNRFDETIIFRPLDAKACHYIVQKNLSALTKRLLDDGYQLIITDDVVELLLSKGFSPEFGARPLQRAIQDLVEAEIAKQIITQNIQPGGTIQITAGMIKNNMD